MACPDNRRGQAQDDRGHVSIHVLWWEEDMLIEKTLRNSVMAFAAVVVLTVLLSSIPARAQDGAAYAFLISTGFLCDAGDSGACTAVVKSEGGDTFEISGAGIFNPR